MVLNLSFLEVVAVSAESVDRNMCDHDFKPGIALIPVWGRLDDKVAVRGDTLNMVGSTLGSVEKCVKCGTSYTQNLILAKGNPHTGNESW